LTRINTEEKPPAPLSRRETGKVRAIEWRTVQFLLPAAAACLFWQNWLFSAGVLLGGAVALLNFHWLSMIMGKIFLERKPWHGVQVPIKFFALVLAVFLILLHTRVPAIAFLLGTFSLVLGILFEAIRQGFRT
jgi:hypothetical protein